ncbi:MAG: NADH-quinone oxidoreductase subunit C [Phycisphaerae bacterium]
MTDVNKANVINLRSRLLAELTSVGCKVQDGDDEHLLVVRCAADALRTTAAWLVDEHPYRFATLVVTARPDDTQIDYWFYGISGEPWVKVVVPLGRDQRAVPSISAQVHSADWHERQAEDLFGLSFSGHPRLGDFVLHEQWSEGFNPMRPDLDTTQQVAWQVEDALWKPDAVLRATGAFMMPIGPVYSDYAESAQFFLETVGEDVVRMIPRFFFKYRGIEKLAEGKSIDYVLLMMERFSGTGAVAHALAFCRAIEAMQEISIPPRGEYLRLLWAEIERIRHHLALISDICHSTGMIVPSADADVLEEQALRVCGELAGHRYLYGVVVPGGVTRDLNSGDLGRLRSLLGDLLSNVRSLYERLEFTGSFLDRFEGVGVVTFAGARQHGLVGPVARASALPCDLRVHLPYGAYRHCRLTTEPLESEGDGYARIRVLFQEIFSSGELINQAMGALPEGQHRDVVVEPAEPVDALAWVEAPNGAAFHYVRIGQDGCVERLQLTTPSFTNWHGFHMAAENFAFQDFPIMMASFGLSIAESDR